MDAGAYSLERASLFIKSNPETLALQQGGRSGASKSGPDDGNAGLALHVRSFSKRRWRHELGLLPLPNISAFTRVFNALWGEGWGGGVTATKREKQMQATPARLGDSPRSQSAPSPSISAFTRVFDALCGGGLGWGRRATRRP
jgi:hypothetical protein